MMTLEFVDPESNTEAFRSIGVVVGARGLKGEIRVKPWDSEAPWVESLETVVISAPGKIPRRLTIESAQLRGDVVWLKLEEINTRDEAEKLKGMDVKATESQLPECGENQYYVEDLVGLQVKSMDSDQMMGEVCAIYSSAAGDYLEVAPQPGAETVMVPFQEVFVQEVDMARKLITITGLDSLFEP